MEKMTEENDSAVYQARLVEIFQSCDTGDKGFLSVVEFERLCRQLQLQSEKDRLYKELGLSRTSYNAKVYFEDFKSVLLSLLQEVDPETLAADQSANCIPSSTESSTANITNKNVNQMHSGQSTTYPPDNSDLRLDLPLDMLQDDDEFCASRDWSEENERMSPPSPLKRAYIEDPDHVDYGNKHQRISSSPAQVETFEGNGMLTSSPIVGEGGVDSDTGLEQLRHVCGNLGVGRHGYLSQTELGQVCQYIGMDQMDDEELEILFKKLDADHDGYISFGEFVEGLARHAITPRGLETPGRTPIPRPHSGRKARNPLPPAHYDRWSPAVYASGEPISLFSSLQPSDNSG